MWVRMLPEEYRKARNYLWTFRALMLIPLLLVSLFFTFFDRELAFYRDFPKTWKAFERRSPEFLLYAALMFVCTVLFFICKEMFARKEVVCESCQDLKKKDGIYDCKCGGTLVSLKKMKWIEEDDLPIGGD